MDAFYASVEQRDRPELRGKPVVVGGTPEKRGAVAAASYEARQYGIHSAMPARTAVQRCPHLIFVSPRFDAYRAVSAQIRDIFFDYTDLVEPLSLDEAYLDVTEDKKAIGSALLIALQIKQRIKADLHLTASAGVSINKFLAKIASDLDKPDGLHLIAPDQAATFTEQLPIENFYGVGPATAAKMKALGIETGADLKQWQRHQLIATFGKVGYYYYKVVRAQDERPVVGSQLNNPDLAKTYEMLADKGVNAFYRGEIGNAIAQTVQTPPVVAEPPFKVWPGKMTAADLYRYEVRIRPAVESTYRDYLFYGMGLPSSGGTTVAQTLNLLKGYDLGGIDRAEALHLLIEAERLAFADRGAYIGDPEYVDVPLPGLLNKDYASDRCKAILAEAPIDEDSHRASAGNPLPYQQDPSPSLTAIPVPAFSTDGEGLSTTYLAVADSDGMIVCYTLTIESTGSR